ncbi:glycosyltransferase family 4 protein [Aquimarina algiphila]|uniref:glycosyltransferase family 4 protein n=1 Tax=Aquimarina algiphila TaxID=2047982 RepID=UPI00232B9AA1|nr:glycosyltransferase family 4 protein [Aquimarina algiphila]
MKILIISQYFYPENFKVNDIAFDYVKKGHEVTVLTAKPNYPSGTFSKGYSFFGKRKEKINGVNVVRVPIIPRLNNKSYMLVLNYVSFIFFSWFAVFFRIKGSYDVVFSHLTSPLTSAIPGIWLKRKFNIPLVIWVLDLWPDSVTANSNIKGGPIIKILNKITNYIYKNSDKILVSSNAFKKEIIKNFNVPDNKLLFFPNWAEDIFIRDNKQRISKKINLPDGLNIMFAGNLGESQGFEAIFKAVEQTKNDCNINWIFVGDGRKASWMKQKIKEKKLTNAYMLGRFPLEEMPDFFRKADVMLVSLKADSLISLTIPAKIQAYMASGKTILGMINGEGKNLINDNGIGFAVSAGDYKGLVEKVREFQKIPKYQKLRMEKKAKELYKENFSKEKLFKELEEILKIKKMNQH